MSIVRYDAQRGRTVARKKEEGAPTLDRSGLTMRQIMWVNRRVKTPLINMHSLRILNRGHSNMRITNKRLGLNGVRVPILKYLVQDTQQTTPRSPIRKHKVLLFRLDGQEGKLSDKNTKVVCSCDCVTGDTKVLTDSGWKTIFEIAEPLSPELKYNYSINGKLYPGTAPFHKGKAPVYELSFSNGKAIKATADHRFLIKVNGKRKWRTLDNIRIGDHLVLNDFDAGDVDTQSIEFAEGFFLGVLMGDGTVSSSRYCDLQLYKEDGSEIIEQLRKSGTVASVKPIKNGLRVGFNQRAQELLHKFQFKNKESVTLHSHAQTLGYTSGLIVTDGSVYGTQIGIHGGEPYLRQLQDYLLQFGYSNVSIRKARSAGDKTNLGVSTKDMFSLYLGVYALRKIISRLWLTTLKEKAAQKVVGNKAQKRLPFTRIVGKRYVSRQHVYDISVPHATRFTANGVIAHNCEFFTYYCEYAMAVHKASFIYYCNGKPPVVTNSGFIPFSCKHLELVMRDILKREL